MPNLVSGYVYEFASYGSGAFMIGGEQLRGFLTSFYDVPDTEQMLFLYPSTLHDDDVAAVCSCMATGRISSNSPSVDALERELGSLLNETGEVVAIQNGSAALEIALRALGVSNGDLVLCPIISFYSTAAAIHRVGATPVFFDIQANSFGMNPALVSEFLAEECFFDGNNLIYKDAGKPIKASLVAHLFGNASEITKIVQICQSYNLSVIEDAAEALGCFLNGRHLGCFGDVGILSFNGNKLVTGGAGGALFSRDKRICRAARDLANGYRRITPSGEMFHEGIGSNYAMPGLNASLISSQLSRLTSIINFKKRLADSYQILFGQMGMERTVHNLDLSNYWLNYAIFESETELVEQIEICNENKVETRRLWRRLDALPAKSFTPYECTIADDLVNRVLFLPSGVSIE